MNDTPWFNLPATREAISTKALVIGAGLAGCCTARALAERGWEVTVLEQGADSACGASGNRAALLRPHASRDLSTAERFYADAYDTALALFARLQAGNECEPGKFLFNQTGALQLTDKTHGYRESKHRQIVSRETASKLCGIDLPTGGLYFPSAGCVDIAATCSALLNHPDINLQCAFTALHLLREEDVWHVSDDTRTVSTATLVLANGAALGNFDITRELTITATRGQTTLVHPGSQSTPEIPICGKHYLIPLHSADSRFPDRQVPCWQVGASFDRTNDKAMVTVADNEKNLQGIDALLGRQTNAQRLSGNLQIVDDWAAVRATTPDRLPIAGALPDAEFYRTEYADLQHGRAASAYPDAAYLPGLFVNGGYGSRGLCVSALCAELVATQITGTAAAEKMPDNLSIETEVAACPQQRDGYLQLLHPARFHIRRLKRSKS